MGEGGADGEVCLRLWKGPVAVSLSLPFLLTSGFAGLEDLGQE